MSYRYRRQRLYHVVQNMIGAAILAWFVWYLWRHRAILSGLNDVSAMDIFMLLMLIMVSWLTLSWQGLLFFRQLDSKITGLECFVLTLATAFGNYLPMRAGTVIRAHYMKNVHQMEYIEYGSVSSIRLVLTLIASGLCGFGGLIYLNNFELKTMPLMTVFLGMLLVPSLVFLWRPSRVESQQTFWRLWKNFADAMHRAKRNPTTLMTCIVLIMVQLLCISWRFIIVAESLGYEVDLAVTLALASMANLANFVAITPGGLGLRESLMGYSMMVIGTSFSLGLMIGSIDRVVSLLLVTVLGGGSFLWVWWRLNKHGSARAPS